jgi:hypothetical protein
MRAVYIWLGLTGALLICAWGVPEQSAKGHLILASLMMVSLGMCIAVCKKP